MAEWEEEVEVAEKVEEVEGIMVRVTLNVERTSDVTTVLRPAVGMVKTSVAVAVVRETATEGEGDRVWFDAEVVDWAPARKAASPAATTTTAIGGRRMGGQPRREWW